MNCFEARQLFPALWRRTLAGPQRAELSEHLRSCAKCDHAYRLFALSAPVLHSESQPDRPALPRTQVARSIARPRWLAMCASVAVLVVAGVAAWASIALPIESLSDTIDNPDSAVQQVFGPDLAPPVNNDLAG